ncbi:hypothetical protein PIIN_09916, partial [Serendipita indica DSM 11827]
MKAPARLESLSAILTAANDFLSTLEFFNTEDAPPSVAIPDEEQPLRPFDLELPPAPDPAASFREFGLEEDTIAQICEQYHHRAAEIAQNVRVEFRVAETIARTPAIQARLADVYLGSYFRLKLERKLRKRRQAANAPPSPPSPSPPSPSRREPLPAATTLPSASSSQRSSSSSSRAESSGAASASTRRNSSEATSNDESEGSSNRSSFDKTVIALLEYVFNRQNGYPSVGEKKRIQQETGLTYRQVAVWFQNRRAREKKKKAEGRVPVPVDAEAAIAQIEDEQAHEAVVSAPDPTPVKRQRIHFVQTVYRTEEWEVEDILTDEDWAPCLREVEEEQIREMIRNNELPGLDSAEPPASSWPAPFVTPRYEWPTFPPPEWPRTPKEALSEPELPAVTSEDVDELTDMFAKFSPDIIKTFKYKRRHHIVITLPDDPEMARKVKRKIASIATPVQSDGPIPMWVAKRSVSLLAELEADLQVSKIHAETPPAVSEAPQEPAPLVIPTWGDLQAQISATQQERQVPAIVVTPPTSRAPQAQVFSDEPSSDEQSSSPNTPRDEDADLPDHPALQDSESMPASDTIEDPMKILPFIGDITAILWPKSGQHPAASYHPHILTKETRQVPIELDDNLMNEALQRTLRECGIEPVTDPVMEDERPLVYTRGLSLVPKVAAPVLAEIDRLAGDNNEPLIPLEAHMAQEGYNDLVDPYRILVDDGPEPLPPAAYEPTRRRRKPRKEKPTEIADIGGIPISDLFDPQGMPLPLALLEAAPYTTPMAQAIYDYCIPRVPEPPRKIFNPVVFCNPHFP